MGWISGNAKNIARCKRSSDKKDPLEAQYSVTFNALKLQFNHSELTFYPGNEVQVRAVVVKGQGSGVGTTYPGR